jgi:hypothetical protein
MQTVKLINWLEGLRKVSLARAIQKYGSVSLSEAKHLVDKLLANQVVEVPFSSKANVDLFIQEATTLGAVCKK